MRYSRCFSGPSGPGQDKRLVRRSPTEAAELRQDLAFFNNILSSIRNFSLETTRPSDYLDGKVKPIVVNSKKRETEGKGRSPPKVSKKKAEKRNPFLEMAGTDIERRRRSVDLYRRTQDECFACDAETQTKKKKKSQCRIC